MNPVWAFGNNDTRETEGPNNAGIANFAGDRAGGLVREITQNSIDARDDKSLPVQVVFEIRELSVQALDLHGLKRALGASIESTAIDARYSKQFRRGAKLLDRAIKAKKITALRIVDSNTTGAPDRDGERDKWHSLTKTVGLSNKDSRDAAGSFGLGKHAPFAATDLRTVLYSTAYHENGPGSRLRRRFTGKSILVSHEVDGKPYRASGWLEHDREPARDDAVPDEFQLVVPGTEIDILGFDGSDSGDWQTEAAASLVTHFFHALAHNNLRASVGSTAINSETLDAVVAETDQDGELQRFIRVSRSPTVESTEIEGVGRVNLRIIVDDDGEHGKKSLALVRDAGMMITDRLGSLRITPSQAMFRIPRHWLGFTAVVECLSEGKRSLLREAEGPRHDSISSDFADQADRKEVGKALRALGVWIRGAIEKQAKPPEPATTDNADEMAEELPLAGNGVQPSLSSGQASWEITSPQQLPRAPRGLGSTGRRRRSSVRERPGGYEQGTHPENGQGKKRRKRKGGRSESVQVPFSDLRRLPNTLRQWPEHAGRFTFSVPDGVLKHIRLYAIGEDGKETQVLLERAYIHGRRIPVKRGEIAEIPSEFLSGERVELELKALRPIADRRLQIKVAAAKKTKRK